MSAPGCTCQRYGKSGVPHATSWRCLVCGDLVSRDRPFICPTYRPARTDPTGACATCGAPGDAHTFAARALGAPLSFADHRAFAPDDPEPER